MIPARFLAANPTATPSPDPSLDEVLTITTTKDIQDVITITSGPKRTNQYCYEHPTSGITILRDKRTGRLVGFRLIKGLLPDGPVRLRIKARFTPTDSLPH